MNARDLDTLLCRSCGVRPVTIVHTDKTTRPASVPIPEGKRVKMILPFCSTCLHGFAWQTTIDQRHAYFQTKNDGFLSVKEEIEKIFTQEDSRLD